MKKSICLVVAASAISLFASHAPSPIVQFIIPAGKPDEAEVRSLVKTLDDHGFSDFLIYPSTGLDYEYLGEDFFKMDATFLDEAKRRGMKVWLYDEFNWPSGTARGRVPAENDACLYRELVASTNRSGDVAWQLIASREINVDNYCLDGNNFESVSVNRFMELTHFAYEKRFAPYFGSTIRGIFSDEPGHCSSSWKMKMPHGTILRVPYWSTMEREYAAATNGRNFREDVARALRGGRPSRAEIFGVWTELRSKRYRQTFFDPIRRWCDKMNIVSCGHLYAEEGIELCSQRNGLPINTISGFSKPGIDLITSDTGRGFQWMTLAFAQTAARRCGRPGIVELFALGPADLPFTIMRKLYWICALHRIDTYFQSLYHHRAFRFDVKESWAMFTSPTQPWFDEMPLLHETAREAAKWANKSFKNDIAIVYPERRAGAAYFGDGPKIPLYDLCGELTWHQLTYDLIEENEPTSCAVVIDWKGAQPFDRISGRDFKTVAEVREFLDRKFARRARVKDASGHTRPGFVTREFTDGSAVAVNAESGEIIVSENGRLIPRTEGIAGRSIAKTWEISLNGPSKRRTWFWTRQADAQRDSDTWLKRVDKVEAKPRYDRDNLAKIVVEKPLKGVKFALCNYPTNTPLSVTMDGQILPMAKPCVSLAYAFDPLYFESEPIDIAPGEHVFELKGRKDGKLFLPAMVMIGDFAEPREGVLTTAPKTVPLGSLAQSGFSSFAGTATYRANVVFQPGEKLLLDTGLAVARVRLGGRDLGARGWAPFEWKIPTDLAGRSLPLEIDIVTSIRPIFGSVKSPDAKLRHAIWARSEMSDPSRVGLNSAAAIK